MAVGRRISRTECVEDEEELLTEVEMLRAGLYRATDQHVAGE